MTIVSLELKEIADSIFEWMDNSGKSIEEAPPHVQKKIQEYRELYDKLLKEELECMGCKT